MLGRDGLKEFPGVVDHELAGQALDLRFVLRQLAAVELDVGVPAEGVHAGHEGVHDVESQRAQTGLDRSEILGAVVDVPGWDTKKRVQTIFLSALSREPSAEEMEKFTSYVDRGGAANDQKKALGDVFWVLLNSPEFLFNH